MTLVANKKTETRIPRYKTIAQDIQNGLATSTSGQMLPSERELSKQYLVSHTTVRKVLDVLEREGRIKRYHGRGSVILDPIQQGEFAIVIRPLLVEAGSSPFYRNMSVLLSEKIRGHNENWSPMLHLGGKANSSEEYPATLDLVRPDVLDRLRGIFSFHPLLELVEPLRQDNIPIVLFNNEGGEDRECHASVDQDRTLFYRESARHLRMKGCKTVGFMWHKWYDVKNDQLSSKERYYSLFAKEAIEAGLSTHEKWMPAVIGDITELKAYERFIEFWKQGDCPDGLIISDDIMARGVLRAILHQQIRLPEQFRLISHANSGVEFPYHLDVTRYEYDLDEMASLAVDVMIKLLQGKMPKQRNIYMPGTLIEGKTT